MSLSGSLTGTGWCHVVVPWSSVFVEPSISDGFAQILHTVRSWCHDVLFTPHWPKQVKWLNLESRHLFPLKRHCCYYCWMFCVFVCVEVRGQLCEGIAFLPPLCARMELRLAALCGKYLYPLSHLFYFLVWRGGKSHIAKVPVKRLGGIIV